MTCDEVKPLLSAYSDDELPAIGAVAVAAHLSHCEACSARLADLGAMRLALREALPHIAAPDVLRARVRAAIADDVKSSPASRADASVRVPFVARVAAALVLVALGSATTIFVQRNAVPRDGAVVEQLVDRQVRAMMAGRAIAVVSSEHHTVKPWFAGRLALSPPVPALDSVGAALEGARVDTVNAQPAAVLVYRKRLHVIGVFVTAITGGVDQSPSAAAARGYNVVRWTRGDMAFAAVSDLNVTELKEFAAAFRRTD